MESIPVPPSNDYTEAVHGLDWDSIFRSRNAIARRWFVKFRRLIPEQEFLSVGNLAIVQAGLTYEPGRPPPFAVYLAKALNHRMASVPRDEWSGWGSYVHSDERDTRGRRKLLQRVYHTPGVEPLPSEEVDDDHDEAPHLIPAALHTHVDYEQAVYIQEGLRWIAAHVHGTRRAYVCLTLDGTGPQEIAAQYHVTLQTIQNALKRTIARVQQWSSEGIPA